MENSALAIKTPFQLQAGELLKELGFRNAELIHPNKEGNPFRPRDLELDTHAGKLYCSIQSDFLAFVFWDVEKAKAHPALSGTQRLNPYSGKWVWYDWEPLEYLRAELASISLQGALQCPNH